MSNPAPGFRQRPDHQIVLSAPEAALTVRLGDVTIAASRRAIRLDEDHCPPRYYLPREDVDMARLSATAHSSYCPFKGDARYWTVEAGGRQAVNAAWAYDAPYDECLALAGRIAFYGERFEFRVDSGRP